MSSPSHSSTMSVNARTTVLDLFESIYAYNDNLSESHGTVLEAIPERLANLYNASVEELVILAYLVHKYPEKANYKDLWMYLRGNLMHPQKYIKSLCDKSFLFFASGDITEIGNIYLKQEAYDAFKNETEFGFAVYPDIVAALKEHGRSIVKDKNKARSFSRSLALESNKQIREGLEQLNIQKYTASVQDAFWTIVCQFINHFVTPLVFCGSELIGEYDNEILPSLKEGLCELEKDGIVMSYTINGEENDDNNDRFVLSPKTAGLLFKGHDELISYNHIAKYAMVIAHRTIAECPLYFEDDVQKEVDNLMKMISQEGYKKCLDILKRQGRNGAIISMLWGPPGTGKTEAVKQLARKSGRNVILFDVAKVTGSLWGVSEKLYRAVFLTYSYMANISDNVPILLMNEADAILSRRITSITRSIDKSENAVSNILLQEFEDFTGILLATTNLIDNLDPAFDRRFLFKTRIQKPDEKARFHIWKTKITDLTDDDARKLAGQFEMSGAQIDNVATKRNLAELYYDGDRGLSYIQDLCRKELSTEKGSASSRKRIGF